MAKKRTTKFNRSTSAYKEWRLLALNRDDWKCKICGKKTSLNVHHIYPVSTHRKLALDNDNSVVLCRQCHSYIRFKELAFAILFKKLISNKILNKTEQTLFNTILNHRKIRLYGGKIKTKTKESKVNKNRVPTKKIYGS